ncbi:MAG TPA: hypothetical protein VGJ69_09215 [Pyrinomonadaceae bacterium]
MNESIPKNRVRWAMTLAAVLCSLVVIVVLVIAPKFLTSLPRDVPPPSPGPSENSAGQDATSYLLWTRGYPRAVRLAQAVQDFNARAARDEVGQTQPPLKVEEVLAAIRGWSMAEEPIESSAFAEFQKIGANEIMPPGSFLDFGKDAENRNGYDTEAWSVYIYIRLDKYPRDQVGMPSFVRLVRMQYISSTKSKSKLVGENTRFTYGIGGE